MLAPYSGEGEHPLLELCETLGAAGGDPARIPNLWVKHKGQVVRNEIRPLIADLDALPYPDRDLFPYQYLLNDYYEAEFMGSRGCPYGCAYCVNHALIELYRGRGPYVRFRLVGNLLGEIEQVARRTTASTEPKPSRAASRRAKTSSSSIAGTTATRATKCSPKNCTGTWRRPSFPTSPNSGPGCRSRPAGEHLPAPPARRAGRVGHPSKGIPRGHGACMSCLTLK